MPAADIERLIEAFSDYFLSDGQFSTIVDARNQAAYILDTPINPGTSEAKLVDEAIEAALVRTAREIVQQGNPVDVTYQKLVQLYQNQPTLGVRSSTSVRQQAYSTPLPIAYLATILAGIEPQHSIYEPTAGHGALLLNANPHHTIVNELNPDRAHDLRTQGFTVSQFDAVSYLPDDQVDAVILNPPFGSITNGSGHPRQFSLGRYRTSQIDHAIALNALNAMKPQGRAALILAGQLGEADEVRSQSYNSRETRAFYYTLYNQYRVTCHISIDGSLYRKQGANFPIDLIMIDGQGKSPLSLPAADVPPIYHSFDQLGDLLNARHLQQSPSVDTTTRIALTGSVATSQRDRDSNRGTLSRTDGTASHLPDSALDDPLRSISEGDRNTPRYSANELEPEPVSSIFYFSRREEDAARNVAQNLGGSLGTTQPDTPPATEPTGNLLSRNGDSERGRKRESFIDVPRQRRDGTQLGGMADHTGNQGRNVMSSELMVQSSELGEGYMSTGQREELVEASETTLSQALSTQSEEHNTAEPPKQVAYQPHSQAPSVKTLVPVNMQTATSQALSKLSKDVGSLDAFVAERLNYGSTDELHQYFSAEQVDALALAIANIERGSGFVIGDQTGIGKGRVVAATIRYAKLIGRTPLFVTKDAPLYADMIRDLADIGMTGFKPFVTNSTLSLPLPDGRTLKTRSQSHKEEMAALNHTQKLGDYDGIFTTYSQLQTVRGKETDRRQFLRTFAQDAILILDESHEAGGDGGQNLNKNAPSNRAGFARELIERADGVLYSSATYAKRPNVMDLYSRTDMRLAVSHSSSLASLVESGGVPLQQTLATMLTESGQYLRRERSFEGVTFSPDVVSVNRETANNISLIMSRILAFDRHKQVAVKSLDKDLKAEAKALLGDSATGTVGASSTNFTSIMHNLIEQMLLSLKAEATVEQTLSLLSQNEKPVIALSSTMGSFIGDYAQLNDLKVGEDIDLNFGDLLRRYLERSRDVMVGNPYGEKTRQRLNDDQLGTEGVAEYQAVLDLIAETDLNHIPISPIDYIKHRIQQEGYRIDEITGREHTLEYSPELGKGDDKAGQDLTLFSSSALGLNGSALTEGDAAAGDNQGLKARYQRRSGKERSKATAVRHVQAFNNGKLDVLILNRSGSTGISLHASEKFADQRRRHMIVAQPDRDINQFMQMLGRVHRTGQVMPPNFTLLMADIPAEKRPGAVLAKKMASLNANTTAARASGVSLDTIPDFINAYGSQVIVELMQNYPRWHERLGEPLRNLDDDSEDERAIEKVTGRIPLLPLEEQEQLYNLIEREYQELVTRQEALGESILEAKTLDLDAKTLSTHEVIPADQHSDSPFTRPVQLEVVNVKTPRKPYSQLQAINHVRQTLELSSVQDLSDHNFEAVAQQAKTLATQQQETLKTETEAYRQDQLPRLQTVNAIDHLNEKLERQVETISNALETFPVGTSVQVTTPRGNNFYGVIARFISPPDPHGSPAAPSNWKVHLLLADPLRELTLPLSRFNSEREGSLTVTAEDKDVSGIPIYEVFDKRQQVQREVRQIFTGNLLRAYEKFKGTLIHYTDRKGNIHQGLLAPKDFDLEQSLERQPVAMPTVEDAKRFLEQGGILTTLDEKLAVKRLDTGSYSLQTPKAKDIGGRYFLDDQITEAAGNEFFSVSDRMACSVSPERLDVVLETLIEEKGYTLAAFSQRQKAREMLGITLLNLELPEEIALDEESEILETEIEKAEETISQEEVTAEEISHQDEITPNEEFPSPNAEPSPIRVYLEIKEQYPDALVMMRLGDFYETFYDDAATLSSTLDLIQVSRKSDDPALGQRVPMTGFPHHALSYYQKKLTNQGHTLVILDDNPPETQQLSLNLEPSLPQPRTRNVERPPPSQEKGKGEHNGQETPLERLRMWYRAAAALGSSDAVLKNITALGRYLKQQQAQGQSISISPITEKKMTTDLAAYQVLQQERGRKVAESARFILSQTGNRSESSTTTYQSKHYQLVQTADSLTVQRLGNPHPETILQVSGDQLTHNSLKGHDCQRFASFVEHLKAQQVQQELVGCR